VIINIQEILMRCPICPASLLANTQLAPQLSAHACLQCGGLWIASTDYWAWIEQPEDEADHMPEPIAEPIAEPPGARRCAGCGHIQLRYPIAADLPFQLDQCGHCNSFWLDRHEWNILRERGLHRQLHKITNLPWQRRLRQEAQRNTWHTIYTARFGPADYAEIQRVRAWLEDHSQRDMLLAYLISPDPYQP
jgi:Zn-finger nucleic acid-binding protein